MTKQIHTVEIVIERPNGTTETMDVTGKFFGMTSGMLQKIREATAQAGRGNVVKAIVTDTKNNAGDLQDRWNRINNEGGEGYVPEIEYFKGLPEYEESVEVAEIR